MLELKGIAGAIYLLRDVRRQGWLDRGVPEERCESVFDHSVHASLAGYHFTRKFYIPHMLLVHDLSELIVGDITPHDNIPPEEKRRRETEAMHDLTKDYSYGQEVMELWQEYDQGQTPEAKIAKQLDKLDAAVKALVYEAQGFEVSEFYPYTQRKLTDPDLQEILEILLRKEHDLKDSHGVYFRLLSERCQTRR